jgi:uncharacterized SAM-binding protein YcdF (DUF218 family)
MAGAMLWGSQRVVCRLPGKPMFYTLAKLLWPLAQPSNLLVLLLLLASLLAWRTGGRLARRLLAGVILALAVSGLVPVGQWLLVPLENRFPPPAELPTRIDGVVMLGGIVEPKITAARGAVALGDPTERITTLIELAARYPDARLVISADGEAAMLRRLLRAQGLPSGRILFEDRARDTYENAVFSRNLAEPRPGERWLLVTSAAHMPRAVGCFEQVGWPVIAYPVDYQTTGRFEPWARLDVGLRLHELDQASRAWVGAVVYWLGGRTGALFPAP